MLMLTDTAPDFDRRVNAALAEQGQPPLIVIARRTSRGWRYLSLVLALALLPALWLRFGRPLARLGRRVRGGYGGWRSGLRAFVLLQAASLACFWGRRHELRRAGCVYAHDQMAGTVAWLARRAYGVPYVYDAHEIVPFRARQTGPARMLLEYGWERAIVRASRRCRVVNLPMQRFYRRLYGGAEFEVRTNDFFAEREADIAAAGRRLVVYIGALGRHRGLERMAEFAAASGAAMLCFCSNVKPGESGPEGAELHGIADYEPRLLERVAGAAPYVWCAFDTDVLSYRYSLPNKFFQAMALGIPIIAARGSYLGRLATRHGIGAVIESASSSPVEDLWSEPLYATRARAMAGFRSAYRRGEVSV